MRRALASILLLLLVPAVMRAERSMAQTPLIISGVVWHDSNFDGVRQASEQTAPNVVVLLHGPDGKHTNATATALDGTYRFVDLPQGSYELSLKIEANLIGTTAPELALEQSAVTRFVLTSPKDNVNFGVVYVSDLLSVGGSTWIDGMPTEGATVRSLVDGNDCTVRTNAITPPDSGPAFALTFVAPAGLIPGCGEDGKTVSFTINGLPAHETVPWESNGDPLALTAGHTLALFVSGGVSGIDPQEIKAFVDGVLCSESYATFGGFYLAVYSAEQQVGCGRRGSTVELSVNGKPAKMTLTWEHGLNQFDFAQYVDDSFVGPMPGPNPTSPGIRPPDTGDGGLK